MQAEAFQGLPQRRPDGSLGTYEHLDVLDTVRVVAQDGIGNVLLVEDHFYVQGRRMLHLPGGSTSGETPRAAGQRELEGGKRPLSPNGWTPWRRWTPCPG